MIVFMRRHLARRHREDESVLQYVEALRLLFRELLESLSEAEKVRLTFRNLAEPIQLMLCNQVYDSVRQLVADAHRVEYRAKRLGNRDMPAREGSTRENPTRNQGKGYSGNRPDFRDQVSAPVIGGAVSFVVTLTILPDHVRGEYGQGESLREMAGGLHRAARWGLRKCSR